MPKAVSRRAGPQTARSTPYPAPTAPSTTDPSDTPSITSSNSSGPLSARSTNVPSKKGPSKKGPKSTSTSAKETTTTASSFLTLTLPHESTHDVPVYDSCSQIRTKIKSMLDKHKDKPENAQPDAFLKNGTPKPWTAKAFCDAIGVSTSSYQNFMKKTGHMGGAENGTFYGAYVFFEKKRVAEGAGKSAARVKMEAEWPRGLELTDPNSISIWVRDGENPRDFIPKLYGGTQPASIWSKR